MDTYRLDEGQGTFWGMVYDTDRKPLNNAEIVLSSLTGSPLAQTRTDINGRFTFPSLPFASYVLRARTEEAEDLVTTISFIRESDVFYGQINRHLALYEALHQALSRGDQEGAMVLEERLITSSADTIMLDLAKLGIYLASNKREEAYLLLSRCLVDRPGNIALTDLMEELFPDRPLNAEPERKTKEHG